MAWAYNARSTRPVVHWWEGSSESGGITWRRALCGAVANDDLLDSNFRKLKACERCAKKLGPEQQYGGGGGNG